MKFIAHQRKETYPSKADFVSEVVEAADTVLSVFEVMVLDESEAAKDNQSLRRWDAWGAAYPLQRLVFRSMMDLELWMSPKRLPHK